MASSSFRTKIGFGYFTSSWGEQYVCFRSVKKRFGRGSQTFQGALCRWIYGQGGRGNPFAAEHIILKIKLRSSQQLRKVHFESPKAFKFLQEENQCFTIKTAKAIQEHLIPNVQFNIVTCISSKGVPPPLPLMQHRPSTPPRQHYPPPPHLPLTPSKHSELNFKCFSAI